MKFYSILRSERKSRDTKKGGDEWIQAQFFVGNKHIATVDLFENSQKINVLKVREHSLAVDTVVEQDL